MIHNTNVLDPQWFAFYASIKCEKKAADGLREVGFDAYVPMLTVWITHARKRVAAQRPLFSRYGFVKVDLTRQGFYDARAVQGVESFVGSQGRPMAISASIIERLQKAEAAGGFDQTKEIERVKWKAGQPVRVLSGPMAGFVGMVARANDKRRVEILLTMLGSERAITVESAMLEGVEA